MAMLAARYAATAAQARTTSVHRLGSPPPERVAVFRALQLGDLLCAVPALRALRAALPAARITLVGLPWASDFAARYSRYIDDFLAFPGAPGLPEGKGTAEDLCTFYAAAKEARFDVVLQMHGSGLHSNPVVQAIGARLTAGFYRAGEPCPDSQRFLPYPERESEVRRLLRLMEFLGAPSRGEQLEFPITAIDAADYDHLKEETGLRDRGYVCVHPGARNNARRWAGERFAAVAADLVARGMQIALTGTQSEAALTAEVAQAMHAPCVNLAGRTHLGLLAAVVSHARLVICNDTGVSHIAAALRVPSVIIYTASSPQRWAPADRLRHRRVFHHVACRPCEHDDCPIDHRCAIAVTPESVLRQAYTLLSIKEK